jgi:hypothetical protein
MTAKKVINKVIRIIAIAVSLMVLFACVFDLQYSLLIGPFLDVLLLMGLTLIGLIFSIITIPLNGLKKILSYLPLILIIAAFGISFALPRLSLGHYIHYSLNKKNLEFIDTECKKANIYEMTDMLRHHKRLNEKSISNDLNYTKKEEIENAFGEYINEQGLDIHKIAEIQEKLIDSKIISIHRTDDFLILTIDGFVDNEYGYVKSFSKEIKEGETLPPFGFGIVRLIEFKNGWYFFYTT